MLHVTTWEADVKRFCCPLRDEHCLQEKDARWHPTCRPPHGLLSMKCPFCLRKWLMEEPQVFRLGRLADNRWKNAHREPATCKTNNWQYFLPRIKFELSSKNLGVWLSYIHHHGLDSFLFWMIIQMMQMVTWANVIFWCHIMRLSIFGRLAQLSWPVFCKWPMYVTKELNCLLSFAIVPKKNIHNYPKRVLKYPTLFQLHTWAEQLFSVQLTQQAATGWKERPHCLQGRLEDPAVSDRGAHYGDLQEREATSLVFVDFVLKTVILHKNKFFLLTCNGVTTAVIFK